MLHAEHFQLRAMSRRHGLMIVDHDITPADLVAAFLVR
jgi:hypothetical protein